MTMPRQNETDMNRLKEAIKTMKEALTVAWDHLDENAKKDTLLAGVQEGFMAKNDLSRAVRFMRSYMRLKPNYIVRSVVKAFAEVALQAKDAEIAFFAAENCLVVGDQLHALRLYTAAYHSVVAEEGNPGGDSHKKYIEKMREVHDAIIRKNAYDSNKFPQDLIISLALAYADYIKITENGDKYSFHLFSLLPAAHKNEKKRDDSSDDEKEYEADDRISNNPQNLRNCCLQINAEWLPKTFISPQGAKKSMIADALEGAQIMAGYHLLKDDTAGNGLVVATNYKLYSVVIKWCANNSVGEIVRTMGNYGTPKKIIDGIGQCLNFNIQSEKEKKDNNTVITILNDFAENEVGLGEYATEATFFLARMYADMWWYDTPFKTINAQHENFVQRLKNNADAKSGTQSELAKSKLDEIKTYKETNRAIIEQYVEVQTELSNSFGVKALASLKRLAADSNNLFAVYYLAEHYLEESEDLKLAIANFLNFLVFTQEENQDLTPLKVLRIKANNALEVIKADEDISPEHREFAEFALKVSRQNTITVQAKKWTDITEEICQQYFEGIVEHTTQILGRYRAGVNGIYDRETSDNAPSMGLSASLVDESKSGRATLSSSSAVFDVLEAKHSPLPMQSTTIKLDDINATNSSGSTNGDSKAGDVVNLASLSLFSAVQSPEGSKLTCQLPTTDSLADTTKPQKEEQLAGNNIDASTASVPGNSS